jgi:hypothetical protein
MRAPAEAKILSIVTWKWGNLYSTEDVAKLMAGCRRHMKQPFRFLVITDNLNDYPEGAEPWAIRDPALCDIKGCYARLRMFDPEWMAWHEVDRLLCLDLDLVVTGPLDALVDREEKFLIWLNANQSNPCRTNGSVMYLRVGCAPEVWSDFTVAKSAAVPYHEFPDDQNWINHKLPNCAGWNCGPESGIWAFGKRGWPKDNKLPEGARIVAFPGARDPSQFTHLDWVKEHWRA